MNKGLEQYLSRFRPVAVSQEMLDDLRREMRELAIANVESERIRHEQAALYQFWAGR